MKQIIAGIHPVREALDNNINIDRAYIKEGQLNDNLRQLLYDLRRLHIPIFRVPVAKLKQFYKGLHQGIVVFQPLISYASLDFILSQTYSQGRMPAVVLIDNITDIRNLGALVRTTEHAGLDALVLESKGNAMINDIAFKTSAGALNILPICRVSSLVTTINYLKSQG